MTDDVVTELDRYLVRDETVGFTEMVQRARDEIVALREEYETMKGAFEGLHNSIRPAVAESVRVAQVRIRNEALEEAAQACVGSGAIVAEARLCAAAIRTLKERRDE